MTEFDLEMTGWSKKGKSKYFNPPMTLNELKQKYEKINNKPNSNANNMGIRNPGL